MPDSFIPHVIIALSQFGILFPYFFSRKKGKSMSEVMPHEQPLPPTIDAPEYEQVTTPDEASSGVALPVTDDPESVPDMPDEEAAVALTAEEKSFIAPSSDSNLSVPSDVSVALRQLAKDFETKLKYDASKQELIDKLYKENMEFKEGIIKRFQQAMITAVIERIDDAAKDIATFENRKFSEENYRKLLASYSDITAGFQDMLSSRFNVECFSCEPLTRFDPKTQRSLKTCPTDDADKSKLVKQTLRPGYQSAEDIILRPELVEVYVFDEKLIEPDTDGVEDNSTP